MAVKINKVVLVDENDQIVGEMEKLQAHKKARLHRAVSVFIVNSNKEWLLQRRADGKYHSAGLWSNTSCTHPKMDEESVACAKRRLKEEMGIETNLQYVFNFIYRAELDHALCEHELDHVFIGMTDAKPQIDQNEVSDWKYMSYDELKKDMNVNPDRYTEWFKKMHKKVYRLLDEQYKEE
ncbi:MAG: isopentenyl-diphosphate Delta-isomerase [Bacteroidales bacterium]